MTDAILRGAVTGYAIALPVGAVAAYLVGLTARTSLRIGAPAALGVATTDGIYALVAVMGGAALAAVIAPVADPLRVTSAVLLVGVAAYGAVRAVQTYAAPVGVAAPAPARRGLSPLRAYLALIVITAVNPATVVYFAAVVLGSSSLTAASAPERVAFALAAFAASASWQLVVVCGGALVGHLLTGPRGRLGTALASSAVILALAAKMLLE
jgi:arginine exporter protein ArgO